MRIEIKDKGLLIKNAAAASAIVLLFICFVWQVRVNTSLRQQLSVKKAEFKEAKSASSRLKKLQRQIQYLEEKERAINNQAPAGEKQPFDLVKTLTSVSADIGLRNMTFTIKGPEKPAQAGEGAMTVTQQQEGLEEDSSGAQENQAQIAETQTYAAAPATGPVPVKLELSFEATYPQALNFLKRVSGLERVVAVESIKIGRKKEILPYQKVSLKLVAYSFPAQ